jgi:hypothetical protein
MAAVLSWRPDAVDPAELAAGLKAAKELNSVPVSASLSKQLSNYILRAERELETRAATHVIMRDDPNDHVLKSQAKDKP